VIAGGAGGVQRLEAEGIAIVYEVDGE